MAGRKEAVVDASVVVKWFSEEDGTEDALGIREEHLEGTRSLLAPDLLIYEIANALRFKPGFDQRRVAMAAEDLLDMQIDFITPGIDLLRRCSTLAFKYNLTIYDSSYMGLGELLGLEVLTSDRQFYERCKDCGFLRFI